MLFKISPIVSVFSKFHEQVKYLKDVFQKNSFPTNSVDKCIKMFLNKQFLQKIIGHTVPEKELFIVLPYLGVSSLCFRTRLKKASMATCHFVKLKLFLNHQDDYFFRFKDTIPLCLHSKIVYKFTCGRCDATYYGETCRHFKVRVAKTKKNQQPLKAIC